VYVVVSRWIVMTYQELQCPVPINQKVATKTTDAVGDKHCDKENQQSTSRLVNKENNINTSREMYILRIEHFLQQL